MHGDGPDEAIDLVSDTDEVENVRPQTTDHAPPSNSNHKTAAQTSDGPPGGGKRARADDDDDDEELQFVGRKGNLPLADFPHSREHCAEVHFKLGDKDACFACCKNCYCFVCDAPTAACEEWESHCMANHSDDKWVQARAAHALKIKAQHAKAQPTASSVRAPPSTSAPSPHH